MRNKKQQARDTIDLCSFAQHFFLFDWRSTKFKTFVVCVGRFNQVNLTILDEIYQAQPTVNFPKSNYGKFVTNSEKLKIVVIFFGAE